MVDRPDVEVRQRTELTGTNRSCGLTTYCFPVREPSGLLRRRVEHVPGLAPGYDFSSSRAGRRSKSHQQSYVTPIEDNACDCVSRFLAVERSHSPECLSEQLIIRSVRASHFEIFPGGYTEEVTPVPIPNTEVELFRADGTAGATLWESRTLPGF